LNTKNFSQSQKNSIISTLKGGDVDWKPVWNNGPKTSFKYSSSQLSDVTVIPLNTSTCHMVLIWPKSDYGGDGEPIGYDFGGFFGKPFIDLGEWPVQNQHGNIQTCRIWIKDFKSAGTETFTIKN